MERNLELCHKAAIRMLSNFHKLSKRYKAADFTWHSTVAYTLGFGTALHTYRKRAGQLSQEQFDAMKNEFAGWMSLMAYADLVLRTNNHLQRCFDPLVKEIQAQCGGHSLGRSSVDGTTSGGPFTHINAVQGVKPERSPQPGVRQRSSLDLSNLQGGSNPQMNLGLVGPMQGQHNFHNPTPFSATQNNIAMGSYGISPNVASFPPLPMSLAPLLNEPSPGDMPQYSQPIAMVQQDVSMMYQPQLYTENTATYMWPIQG